MIQDIVSIIIIKAKQHFVNQNRQIAGFVLFSALLFPGSRPAQALRRGGAFPMQA